MVNDLAKRVVPGRGRHLRGGARGARAERCYARAVAGQVMRRCLLALLVPLISAAPAHAAIRSDGTSTQHLAGPHGSSPSSGAVTLMQWHKLNVDHNAQKVLLNLHNNGDGGTFHNIMLLTQSDGTTLDFVTFVSGSASSSRASVQSITVGTWYHYAIVRSGSSIKLYTGSESSPSTLVATLRDRSLASQSSVWRWTATGNSASGFSADASIERFKMYNAELSESQINAERASPEPSNRTRLWTYNPFTTAGSYGADHGSNRWTFSEQGGTNFSTVSGPAIVETSVSMSAELPAAALRSHHVGTATAHRTQRRTSSIAIFRVTAAVAADVLALFLLLFIFDVVDPRARNRGIGRHRDCGGSAPGTGVRAPRAGSGARPDRG